MSGSKMVKGVALLFVVALAVGAFMVFNSQAVQGGAVADAIASPEAPAEMVGQVERFTFSRDGRPMYTVDFDSDWIMRPGRQAGDITGTSKDGVVWVLLTDVQGPIANFEAAGRTVSAALLGYLSNVNMQKAVSGININGMTAAAYQGTAKDAGEDVVFVVVIFAISRNEIGGMVFLMEPNAKATHIEEVRQIAKTARPAVR